MNYFALIIAVVSLIPWFLTLDAILRAEYKRYYSDWEKDGMPYGVFFIPQEAKSFLIFGKFRNGKATQRICVNLFFAKPAWALNDNEVLNLIFWFRIFGILSLLFWVAFISNAVLNFYANS